MITRATIRIYLQEHKDRGEAIAALIEDYPELEKESPLHNRPLIEVLLDDLETYRAETAAEKSTTEELL